jgi:hypothetical protein
MIGVGSRRQSAVCPAHACGVRLTIRSAAQSRSSELQLLWQQRIYQQEHTESYQPRPRRIPRSYADMLERQQTQLISCVQELYQQLRTAGLWGQPLPDGADRHPPVHDISEDKTNATSRFDLPYYCYPFFVGEDDTSI